MHRLFVSVSRIQPHIASNSPPLLIRPFSSQTVTNLFSMGWFNKDFSMAYAIRLLLSARLRRCTASLHFPDLVLFCLFWNIVPHSYFYHQCFLTSIELFMEAWSGKIWNKDYFLNNYHTVGVVLWMSELQELRVSLMCFMHLTRFDSEEMLGYLRRVFQKNKQCI